MEEITTNEQPSGEDGSNPENVFCCENKERMEGRRSVVQMVIINDGAILGKGGLGLGTPIFDDIIHEQPYIVM